MEAAFHDLFYNIVGRDEELFFRDHWRKRTLFVPSAVPHLKEHYTVQSFINDYRQVGVHTATLVISIDRHRNRRMSPVDQTESVDNALSRGLSIVIQALLLPTTLSRIPSQWRWFLDVHQSLCDYLLPGFPPRLQSGGPVAAVDIFCSLSDSSTGGHYDTGDVFYFVLDGEKEWILELVPDLERGPRLANQNSKSDLDPRGECMKVTVRPGDCLYVPPYTYHRVCSHGCSLAVSLGLPTHTELSFMRTSLTQLLAEPLLHHPLPSYPKSREAQFCAARQETNNRLSHAVERLAAVVLGQTSLE